MHEPKKPILIGERVKIQPRGKKGIFTADFWFDGQHHRRSLKTRNFKIVREKALQLENQLLEHSYQPAPPSISLANAIDAYVEHVTTENRRPKTITKYKGFLRPSASSPRARASFGFRT